MKTNTKKKTVQKDMVMICQGISLFCIQQTQTVTYHTSIHLDSHHTMDLRKTQILLLQKISEGFEESAECNQPLRVRDRASISLVCHTLIRAC